VCAQTHEQQSPAGQTRKKISTKFLINFIFIILINLFILHKEQMSERTNNTLQ